ncbi:hypothetical protein MMC30_000506 [Trapelia coarctata]|nr:hypothetical protein [Trapelia coarctata]
MSSPPTKPTKPTQPTPPPRSPSVSSTSTSSAIDPSDIPSLRNSTLDGTASLPSQPTNPITFNPPTNDGWSDTGTAIPVGESVSNAFNADAHDALTANAHEAFTPTSQNPLNAAQTAAHPPARNTNRASPATEKVSLISTVLTLLIPPSSALEVVTLDPETATVASILATATQILMNAPLSHEGGNIDGGARERVEREGWEAASLILTIDGGGWVTGAGGVGGKWDKGVGVGLGAKKEVGKVGLGKIGTGIARDAKRDGVGAKKEAGKEGRVVRVHEGNFAGVLMMLGGGRGELVVEFRKGGRKE